MVGISKTIANKIQEKRSDLTSDEVRIIFCFSIEDFFLFCLKTIRFRSYLLSLGIDNPVTKESAGSQYHVSLAKELASVLEKALKVKIDISCLQSIIKFAFLKDTNGIMTLSDAFCRINRARGYEVFI